jgi:hypothetical protein
VFINKTGRAKRAPEVGPFTELWPQSQGYCVGNLVMPHRKSPKKTHLLPLTHKKARDLGQNIRYISGLIRRDVRSTPPPRHKINRYFSDG